MRPVGPPSPSCPSASDGFPLSRLHSAEAGSESPAAPEKGEVRAGDTVSVRQEGGGADSEASLSVCGAAAEAAGCSRMRSIVSFYLCYLLCLGLGLACVACVCVWNHQWRGGFAWDGTAMQFNWHPVLMVTGLVVFYGYGAVLYRVPLTWGQNKLPWKLLHAALMLLALLLSVVGLCAVFGFHNAKNTPNMYSLHSWVGIVTTALFAAQWAVGVATFLLPCSPASLRKWLKPVHVWFGGSILSLSMISCISGINEKLFFVLKGNTNETQPYAKLPPEAVLGNSLGVLIVAFGLLVLKMLSNKSWQRPDVVPHELAYSPLPQEEN